MAYDSSQQELAELRAAALEVCQEVEEGKAQAGSSLASRLRALGGHVSQRMRHTLHLGIKKALGVVAPFTWASRRPSSEGDLVFWGKPSCPLTLLIRQDLHLYSQLGCWVRCLQNELGNPF
jgi:hypothetical protein